MVLLLLAVFLFSLYQTLRILYGYRQAKAVYENAERAYLIPVSRDETEAETERIPPAIDFEALQAVNKDVIGWIFIEGTEVNYPILLGVNNQQYLFQSYEKNIQSRAVSFWITAAARILKTRERSYTDTI